jgi:hypothetical protein
VVTLIEWDFTRSAEDDGYDVFVTTDQNVKYQQNLAGRRIAVVVLLSTAWPKIRPRVTAVVAAIDSVKPGILIEAPI